MRAVPFLLLSLACAQSADPSDTDAEFEFSPLEMEIHDLVNNYRISEGLMPLEADPVIGQESRDHSADMLDGLVPFGHRGFEDRVARIGEVIPLVGAAENVAFTEGYGDTAQLVVDGWINSPDHQVNMVGDFDLGGVGVVRSDDGLTLYYTHIFVRTP